MEPDKLGEYERRLAALPAELEAEIEKRREERAPVEVDAAWGACRAATR